MMVFLRPGADRLCGSSGSGPSFKRNGFTPSCPSQGNGFRPSWLSDHQKELYVPSWPTNQAEGMRRLARPRIAGQIPCIIEFLASLSKSQFRLQKEIVGK
ncbi:unnamed protein product [Symbiodinium necroappetens]|uniref:Uncharacterized protein n=1 Tax=Symbiodinium necroappetens TaxID=1628268 RepID=A0A812TGZ0_9DINO|nr:unnamed protein product [Symbiodinium necroappetens]